MLSYFRYNIGRRNFYTYSAEPFHPLPGKTPAWKSPEEAVKVIESGELEFYSFHKMGFRLQLLCVKLLVNSVENDAVQVELFREMSLKFLRSKRKKSLRSQLKSLRHQQVQTEGNVYCAVISCEISFKGTLYNLGWNPLQSRCYEICYRRRTVTPFKKNGMPVNFLWWSNERIWMTTGYFSFNFLKVKRKLDGQYYWAHSGFFFQCLIVFFLLEMKVFVHGGAATPLPLLDAVAKRGKEVGLKNVKLIHIHTEGSGEVVKPEYDGE